MSTRKTITLAASNSKAVHIQPKNFKQDLLLNAIREQNPLIIASGPAGVGKTFISVNGVLNLLFQNKINKIVLSRSAIPTGRSLGFFPGTVQEKLEPWLSPMTSEIRRRVGEESYNIMLRRGVIQLYPLETIRGASFNDAAILVDEAQNLTYEEIKSVTTRIGENSTLILMGDPMQKDISSSGLTKLEKISIKHNLPIPVIKFSISDIVRSDIVATLVKVFMYEEGYKDDG